MGVPPSHREIDTPKFVIERDIPGAGKMSPADLKGAALKSCDVLRGMGPRAQWQQSYVTDDKIYCVYFADSEKDVLEHANRADSRRTRLRRCGR